MGKSRIAIISHGPIYAECSSNDPLVHSLRAYFHLKRYFLLEGLYFYFVM